MKRMSFTIYVTTKCNMNCVYCYEKSFLKQEMSLNTARKTVSFIKKKIEENDLTDISIQFHGGEPLLNFEVIKYIINALENSSVNVAYSMTTNSTLIKGDMIPILMKFGSLSVSIDGAEADHNRNRIFAGGQGSYSVVRKNLELLLKHIPDITARMTIMPETYKRIFVNFQMITELGIRNIEVDLDFTSDRWTNEMIGEYLREFKKIGYEIKKKEKEGIYIKNSLFEAAAKKTKNTLCNGGRTTFAIAPNGEIYPCLAVAFNREFLLGTVAEESHNSEVLNKIEEIGKVRNRICEGCARYDYCNMTRCKIINYVYNGDFHEPNPIMCANEHIKVELGKYFLNFPI